MTFEQIRNIENAITEAIIELQEIQTKGASSREASLVLTKLQEAEMWLEKVAFDV